MYCTCRGLQKGHVDARAASFMILLGHLHQMKQPPTCLLLENVVGFEASQTHADMMQTLVACNYMVQVWLVSSPSPSLVSLLALCFPLCTPVAVQDNENLICSESLVAIS